MGSDENITITVGQRIKADREDVGMSVQQLAQATKIMVTFVEALERDDIAALPGKVFARGFIKSIYKVFGKDSAPIIEQFDSENGVDQTRVVPVTQVEQVRTEIVRRESGTRGLPPRIVLGAALAGLCAVGLVIYMSAGPKNETTVVSEAIKGEPEQVGGPQEQAVAQTEDVTEEIQVAEEVAAGVDDVDSEMADDITSASDQTAGPDVAAMQAEAANNDAQLIEIVVKKPVKIRVNIDQNGWETNELSPDTYQFRFDDAANLLLFNAAAVEMSFNGRNLGPLGDEGRVRRLSFVAGSPTTSEKM